MRNTNKSGKNDIIELCKIFILINFDEVSKKIINTKPNE
jgi:hypothetical protein